MYKTRPLKQMLPSVIVQLIMSFVPPVAAEEQLPYCFLKQLDSQMSIDDWEDVLDPRAYGDF